MMKIKLKKKINKKNETLSQMKLSSNNYNFFIDTHMNTHRKSEFIQKNNNIKTIIYFVSVCLSPLAPKY